MLLLTFIGKPLSDLHFYFECLLWWVFIGINTHGSLILCEYLMIVTSYWIAFRPSFWLWLRNLVMRYEYSQTQQILQHPKKYLLLQMVSTFSSMIFKPCMVVVVVPPWYITIQFERIETLLCIVELPNCFCIMSVGICFQLFFILF